MSSDVPVARDWRDTLRDAADLALLGVAMTVASVFVVTAGAAVAAASAAVHDKVATDRLPPLGTSGRRFIRGLLPGLGALVVAIALIWLVGVDVAAVARDRVPGGRWLLGGTLLVALVLVGFAALAVVELGRQGGTGWMAAVRVAARTAVARPLLPVVLGGVVALATLLGVFVPAVLPVLVGYLLFALHVVTHRLAPRSR